MGVTALIFSAPPTLKGRIYSGVYNKGQKSQWPSENSVYRKLLVYSVSFKYQLFLVSLCIITLYFSDILIIAFKSVFCYLLCRIFSSGSHLFCLGFSSNTVDLPQIPIHL
jgi:uncharacterized membrane protein (DUF485 family)